MKYEFLVAVRNDQGQLLVLETHAFRPAFPSGTLEASESALKVITSTVLEETGLVIRGLHLASLNESRTLQVQRYTAFCAGGRLIDYRAEPPSEKYRSASWITPSLIFRFNGLSSDMQAIVNDLGWLSIRDEFRGGDERPRVR